jgi:hypothetical protein
MQIQPRYILGLVGLTSLTFFIEIWDFLAPKPAWAGLQSSSGTLTVAQGSILWDKTRRTGA